MNTGKLKDYFHFNRGERRGLVVLFIILLAVVSGNRIISLLQPEEEYDFSEFERIAGAWTARTDSLKNLPKTPYPDTHQPLQEKPGLRPFPFDPNGLPEEKWLAMGLNEKQIRVIKNFEKKGGRFYSAKDLGRIYSISREEFRILAPFVKISTQVATAIDSSKNRSHTVAIIDSIPDNQQFQPAVQIHKMVDLNNADQSELQELHGIGPSFSARIIKYRELLGGFVRKDQLMEVYGMDSLRFAGIEDHIMIDTGLVVKVKVNEAGIRELMKHPYINYYLAKTIVNYREDKGGIKSIEGLNREAGIPDTIFCRVRPYLGI